MEGWSTVLVAEDAAARILRDAGYGVTVASGPRDVLDRAERERPDLVVLDAEAAGSLEACRAVKRRVVAGELLPVLFVTSGSAAPGFRAGADDVVRRPLDPEELCARVEVWTRTRRLCASAAARAEDAGGRDPLTGLPDARAFTQRLAELFDRAQRDQAPLSIMAIDLDAFTDVNGRHGRSVGDRLLVACARVLVRSCRDTDFVARAGGAELVALLGESHFTGCLRLAERVWRELAATTVEENGVQIACGASVGVASYPARDIDSPKALLRYAHAALARAKAEGHGRICLYQHQGYLFQPEP